MKIDLERIHYEILQDERIEETQEYKRLDEEENKIFNSLDEKHKKIFDKIFNIHSGMMAETEFAHFKLGIKFALTVVMETLFN